MEEPHYDTLGAFLATRRSDPLIALLFPLGNGGGYHIPAELTELAGGRPNPTASQIERNTYLAGLRVTGIAPWCSAAGRGYDVRAVEPFDPDAYRKGAGA